MRALGLGEEENEVKEEGEAGASRESGSRGFRPGESKQTGSPVGLGEGGKQRLMGSRGRRSKRNKGKRRTMGTQLPVGGCYVCAHARKTTSREGGNGMERERGAITEDEV